MQSFSKMVTIPSDAILENIFIQNNEWNPANVETQTLVQSGKDETLFKKVLLLIQSAIETICLQSFLIQDSALIDELVKARERGVKIYITSAAEVRLKPQMCAEVEPDFIQKDYSKMLKNKFVGNFLHRSAESLHAKYIVVDGKTNPRGMIFTNNFTENGFFKNPEIAVELNRAQASALFKLFVFYFWEKTTTEQNGFNDFTPVKPFEQFKFPATNELLMVSDNHNSLKDNILKAIQHAKYEICFSTFSFDNQYEMAQAIYERQKAGVKIKIFARLNDKLLKTELKKYLDAGAEIYCHTHTHAKFLIIDNQEAYLLTANFTKTDFESSFNIGVSLSAHQTHFLSEMVKQWETQMHQWIDKQLVKDLSKYYSLEHGKWTSKMVDNVKTDKVLEKVQTVKQLIDFVQKKHPFSNKNYQKQELTLEVNIQPFKKAGFAEKEYEETNYEHFNLVKAYSVVVENDKKGKPKLPIKQLKESVIVLHKGFDIWNDYNQLIDYQDFMLRTI
jgi:phosphatidylserine/phosphatidylglycerophosphate/cardiolipin synthase-like enzyme